jgi:hypothetical protein
MMLAIVTDELIWHFAGYLHLAEEVALSRLQYDDWHYRGKVVDFSIDGSNPTVGVPPLPEFDTHGLRVNVSFSTPRPGHLPWDEQHHRHVEVQSPDIDFHLFRRGSADPVEVDGMGRSAPPDGQHQVTITHLVPAEAIPTYSIQITDGGNNLVAVTAQSSVLVDNDVYSDDAAATQALLEVPVAANPVPDLLAAAKELMPDPLLAPDQSADHWLTAAVARDHALATGQEQASEIKPGHYVDGDYQAKPAPDAPLDAGLPRAPERESGDTAPDQVAELGGNKALNAAQLADLNEATSTLVVKGDFFSTNAIYQANLLQDDDTLVPSDAAAAASTGGGSAHNVASFAIEDIVKHLSGSRYGGDLSVDVHTVQGDVMDMKILNQRNFIEDGDVSVQTRFDSYSHVITGEGEQANVVQFQDWGYQYDIIIVLGDYHSANIISQINIVYDSDLIAALSGPGASGAGQVHSGHNVLQNDASITNFGTTESGRLDAKLNSLLDKLSGGAETGHDDWSSFHGAASGQLNVLLITGNYYDINVVSQINVISDADRALQVSGGAGSGWLSTGSNIAHNQAEIINAGGIHDQLVGGGLYEDSILIQANLVSESTHNATVDPGALVSEFVAFTDAGSAMDHDTAITWTKDLFSSHDTFGHVLS